MDKGIDNLFRLVSNNKVCVEGKSLIGTFDPTQLQLINGRTLLTSPNIIPYYEIVPI